jgi:hypothetical protein
MKIVITVESMDPPLGCVTSCVDEQATPGDPADGVEFVGWLGLLRVLDELIGREGREPDWP